MKPRPFYRWKSFWLGVVVLVFMGWASWKSRGSDCCLTVGGGSRGYVQMVKLEAITAFFIDHNPSTFGKITFEEQSHDPAEGGFSWEAYWKYRQRSGDRVRFVMVKDRVLFFCFLGLWGGWLIWQWSREQRKLE